MLADLPRSRSDQACDGLWAERNMLLNRVNLSANLDKRLLGHSMRGMLAKLDTSSFGGSEEDVL
eukprot:4869931-Amphidinium_carterae.1